MTPRRRPTTVDPVSAAGSRVTRAAVIGVVVLTLVAAPSCARHDDSAAPPATTGSPAPQLPHPLPTAPAPNVAAVGDIPSISQVVDDAIAAPRLPGAVVQIGHDGKVVLRRAFGERKLAGEPGLDGVPSAAEAMTVDTVFDLASLTKILGTTTAVLQLYEQGRVHIDDPVQTYLPGDVPGTPTGDIVSISTPKLGRLVNRMRLSTECPPWTFGAAALMRNLSRRGLL